MPWVMKTSQSRRRNTKPVKFAQKNRSAYQSATGRGYLDEICSHMTPTKKVWTKDEVLKEAVSTTPTRVFIIKRLPQLLLRKERLVR